MANTTDQNKILTFLEFIELSEGSSKVNPLQDLRKLMRKGKPKKKIASNNPESVSAISSEQPMDFGAEKSSLIVFDI